MLRFIGIKAVTIAVGIVFAGASCKSGSKSKTQDVAEAQQKSDTDGRDDQQTQNKDQIPIDEVFKEQGGINVGASIALLSELPECNTQLAGKLYLVSEDMSLRYCKDGSWMTVNVTSKSTEQAVALFDYDRVDSFSQASTLTSKFYKGDKLLRTCSTSTSSGTLYDGLTASGSMSISYYTGDAGCQIFSQSSIYCSNGYVRSGNSCLKTSTTSPTDPMQCLGFSKKKVSNKCVDVEFVNAPNILCGTYSKPIRIVAGTNFITCNVNFTDRVLVEPGAELRFDNSWALTSSGGFWAKGTAESPISFTVSTNSPSKSWGGMNFLDYSTPLEVDQYFNFSNGTILFENVSFSGRESGAEANSIQFSSAFLRNVSFSSLTSSLKLGQTVAWNSSFSGLPKVSASNNSAIFCSTLSVPSELDGSSHFMWNTSTSSLQTTLYSAGTISIVAFNKIGAHTCYSSYPTNSLHYGNVRSSLVNPGSCTGGSDNVISTTAAVSSRKLLVPRANPYIAATKNQQVSLVPLICADKDGFIANPSIEYEQSFEFDGTRYLYEPATFIANEAPIVKFSAQESYQVRTLKLNGSADYMGNPVSTVDVSDAL